MLVLSAFFFLQVHFEIFAMGCTCKWDLNWMHNRLSFLLIGLSVLPSQGDCREPCPRTECPWQQHSSQDLPQQPVSLKSKILVASFLIKLFLSIIFPLTVGVEAELSLLFMNILGHSYSNWPDANPLWAPSLLKGHLPVPGTCKVLGRKNKLQLT